MSAREREGLIQILLSQFRGKSIREQLRQQKIIEISIANLNSQAVLLPTRHGFIVLLKEGREEKWCEDLGHELSHTFFYVIVEWSPFSWRRNGTATKDEEEFCDEFAALWAELNGDAFNSSLKRVLLEEREIDII